MLILLVQSVQIKNKVTYFGTKQYKYIILNHFL